MKAYMCELKLVVCSLQIDLFKNPELPQVVFFDITSDHPMNLFKKETLRNGKYSVRSNDFRKSEKL